MNAQFNYIDSKAINCVICDTNVWYYLANNSFQKPDEKILTATSLSIVELASSETLTTNLNKFQNVIAAIKKYSGPIVPLNPFDFVLVNQDSKFPIDVEPLKNILDAFSILLSKNLPESVELDEITRLEIKENCRKAREATIKFAEFATGNLIDIRKNINKGKGKKEHVKIDTRELLKEMLISILNDYSYNKGYTFDFNHFNWGNLDFFLVVTENYFKKLELTKGMKVDPNDAVDWLNMLYVTPIDQYLTFEKSWRKIIIEDERSKKYLFESN